MTDPLLVTLNEVKTDCTERLAGLQAQYPVPTEQTTLEITSYRRIRDGAIVSIERANRQIEYMQELDRRESAYREYRLIDSDSSYSDSDEEYEEGLICKILRVIFDWLKSIGIDLGYNKQVVIPQL